MCEILSLVLVEQGWCTDEESAVGGCSTSELDSSMIRTVDEVVTFNSRRSDLVEARSWGRGAIRSGRADHCKTGRIVSDGSLGGVFGSSVRIGGHIGRENEYGH